MNTQENNNKFSDNPLISIVIPAYNEENFLPSTLTSLLEQKFEYPTEIIVVDNNSTDNTNKIAMDFGVRVIRENKKGITHARQAGLMASKGEIIVTTDSDTTFRENWLSNLVQPFFENPKVNLTYGPSYLDIGGSIRVIIFMYAVYVFRIVLYLFPAIAAGHNMAFRKKVAMEIGGYNTKLTHSEDFDIAMRIWKMRLFTSKYVHNAAVNTSSRRVRNENLLKRTWLTITDTFGYVRKKNISEEYDDFR